MSVAAGSEPPSPGNARNSVGDARQAAAPQHPSLTPLEKELAALVYARTAATAGELAQTASPAMRSVDVQAALDRLVAKQVLRETKGPQGARFYVQALRQTEIQQNALMRLAAQQFDGSLANAARLLLLLVHKHQPDTLPALSPFMQSVTAPKG